MKRTKLMLALLGLLVIMALALSACGGGATEAPMEEEKPMEEAPAEEAPAEEAPAEEAGEGIVAEEATPTPAHGRRLCFQRSPHVG
jgi:hypothetical protein